MPLISNGIRLVRISEMASACGKGMQNCLHHAASLTIPSHLITIPTRLIMLLALSSRHFSDAFGEIASGIADIINRRILIRDGSCYSNASTNRKNAPSCRSGVSLSQSLLAEPGVFGRSAKYDDDDITLCWHGPTGTVESFPAFGVVIVRSSP